jgi:hypothetical protein
MKRCIGFKNISLYADGFFSEKKREVLKTHFARCVRCRQMLEQIKDLKVSFSGFKHIELSAGFDFEFNRLLAERIVRQEPKTMPAALDRVSGFIDSIIVPVPIALKAAASLIVVISLFLGIRSQVMVNMPLVEFSAGNARIYRQSKNAWIMPRPQLRLKQGDKIELADGAIINLVSKGKYTARIKDSSLIVVSRLESGLRNINTDFSVSHGKLLVNTTDKFRGSGMRIYTPACDAEVVGTAFMVDVSENNTWLGVLDGRVKVVSKPHPLKAGIERPVEYYVSAGQKAFTMQYSHTTVPELLSSKEWQSMLELYQLVEDSQIILLIGTGVGRVDDFLGRPALLHITDTMKRIIPKVLLGSLYEVAESAKTNDLEAIKNKTDNLHRILMKHLNTVYNTEILMFIGAHFYYAKDYDSALKVFEQVADHYPESEMASLAQSSMASIYQNNLRKTRKAKEIYSELMQLYPNSAEAIRAKEILSTRR